MEEHDSSIATLPCSACGRRFAQSEEDTVFKAGIFKRRCSRCEDARFDWAEEDEVASNLSNP